MKKVLKYLIRIVYLIVGLIFQHLEVFSNRFIGYSKRTEYIRKGSCRQCGKCCEMLAVQYPKFFNKMPRLKRFVRRWYEFRCDFTHLCDEDNYYLFKCNLLGLDRRCSHYHMRPRLCREYPKTRLYGRSHTKLDCGFYFVRRDGQKSFDEELHHAYDKTDSTPGV